MSKSDIVYKQYPPNYAAICKAIPAARRPGVVFAYGDKIFVPSGKELTHHLKVHEAVHCIRQKEIGVDFWWDKYLTDPRFRFYEELLAHRAEYRSMIKDNDSRKNRRVSAKIVAQKLAAPLYGFGMGWEKAVDHIVEEDTKKLHQMIGLRE